MSGPFVYTPSSQYKPTPYTETGALPKSSPLIPNTSLYPHSPYSPNTQLPSAPNTPHHTPFPALPDQTDPWSGNLVPQRPRKVSWQGVTTAAPPVPAFPNTLYPPTPYPPAPGPYPPPVTPPEYMMRSRSFSGPYNNSPYQYTPPPWTTFLPPVHLAPAAPSWDNTGRMIHPVLNGESPLSTFFFDLSAAQFSPVRSAGPGLTQLLTPDELQQPATHPPITSLKIICDAIPQWPVTFTYNPAFAAQVGLSPTDPTPISVGDILVSIHSQLHQRISHTDWAQLSAADEKAVAKAYTKRCKNAPPESRESEKQNGVVRVDFLGPNTRFIGLVKVEDDWSVVKMIVAPNS